MPGSQSGIEFERKVVRRCVNWKYSLVFWYLRKSKFYKLFRLVWLLEPSSKCVLFWIFSIQLLKKHTPEPGNYSLLWQVDAKLITALLLLLITQLLIQIISYLIDNKIITLLLMLLITQLLVQALFDIFNIRYKIKTFSSFKIGKQICPGTVYKCD